jgi:transposase-like protein
MICPKCGAHASKKGFLPTQQGRKQRWLCVNGHTFTKEEAD